jgi:hypothetical protein
MGDGSAIVLSDGEKKVDKVVDPIYSYINYKNSAKEG